MGRHALSFLVSLAASLLTIGCGGMSRSAVVEVRPKQVTASQLLDRADCIIVGVVKSVKPIGSQYTMPDSLGRSSINQQVLVSFTVIATIRDELQLAKGVDADGMEFAHIVHSGFVGGSATTGPERDIPLGPALIPIRRENGRWRSVVDLWRPILPIGATEEELRPLLKSDRSFQNLRRLLLAVPPGSASWPLVTDSGEILSFFFGPAETINDLKMVVSHEGIPACSVCLYLASSYPGQYECLEDLLSSDRCDQASKERALAILARKELDRKSSIQAIRSFNSEYLITSSRSRSLTEAIAVYNMHGDSEVRRLADSWRNQLEGRP